MEAQKKLQVIKRLLAFALVGFGLGAGIGGVSSGLSGIPIGIIVGTAIGLATSFFTDINNCSELFNKG